MPFRFAAYHAECLAAEEVNQTGFRYVIGAVTDKMGHMVFTAPLIYGGFAVASECHDFIGSHHIRTASSAYWCSCRALSHTSRGMWNSAPGTSRAYGDIPAHPLFGFDSSVSVCLYSGRGPCRFAEDSERCFSDMADMIELFFCDNIRDMVPIDPFIHSQTPQVCISVGSADRRSMYCHIRKFLSLDSSSLCSSE